MKSKTKSILFINPTYLIRRPLAELVIELSKQEKVGVLIPKKIFSKNSAKWHNDKFPKNVKKYSYWSFNLPLINFEWPIPINPLISIKMYNLSKKYKTIHMWTYFYPMNIIVSLIKKINKKTKLIISIDTFPGESFKTSKIIDKSFNLYTRMFKWLIFKSPDKIHLYCEDLVKSAKKVGIKKNKLKVIPTGIRIKKIIQTKKSVEISKIKSPIVTFIGILNLRKGVDLIPKIIEEINDTKITFLIIGRGPEEDNLKKIIEGKKLSSRVKFMGWRPDVISILKASDVLLLPSRGEGLPGVVMEAMSAKIPVVSTKIPCITSLVDNNTGFLCEENNVKEYAKNIEKAIKQKKELSKKGFEKIQKYDWEKIIPIIKSKLYE